MLNENEIRPLVQSVLRHHNILDGVLEADISYAVLGANESYKEKLRNGVVLPPSLFVITKEMSDIVPAGTPMHTELSLTNYGDARAMLAREQFAMEIDGMLAKLKSAFFDPELIRKAVKDLKAGK
jgi:hypothetical protein